jgi:hypothetical protein
MGPEWEGTTMAAQEEARNQAVFKLRRVPVEESRRGSKARVFIAPGVCVVAARGGSPA